MAQDRSTAVVLAALMASWPASGQAAVRRCLAVIDQAGEAANELEATRLAMEAWVAAARQSGDGYGAWRLAWGKELSCSAMAAGGVKCRATGQPCRIDQVPGR